MLQLSDNASTLISDFLKYRSRQAMIAIIEYCRNSDLNDAEILKIAEGMALSGSVIKFPKIPEIYDIPSTGGPSSLSTLLCPLILRSIGKQTLKLAVPGRPAGGIDVLAQIQGYKCNPEESEIIQWFEKSGYVHFLANNRFTPLDAIFFNLRKELNALNIYPLVIASLISKKIATGVNKVCLDIRVSEFGNFGKTFKEARLNSFRFNSVAKLAGIESKCVLTNGNQPQQPYIGRSESLLALSKIFSNQMDSHLRKHVTECYMIVSNIVNHMDINYDFTSLYNIFSDNVKIQGGSIDNFHFICQETSKNHNYQIVAPRGGFLSINLKMIRDAIVELQAKYSEAFPDPAGVIIKIESNSIVKKWDQLCTFRCRPNYIKEFETKLNQALIVKDSTLIKGLKM